MVNILKQEPVFVELCGATFEMKPYTPANEAAFIEAHDEARRLSTPNFEVEDGEDGNPIVTRIDPEIDRHEATWSVLRVILDGPFDEIDESELDLRFAEKVMENFLPPSVRLIAQLAGL